MAARPIFYDTETTGIKSDTDRIVEIAAYDPVNDLSLEELVNPGIPIPKEASKVHHITDDMVRDAPTFKEIGQKFIDFCSGDVILIAHNNDNFDVHFLRNEFNRHECLMPEWRFFDTLKWARRYRPDLPRHSLQFLREIYGIEANNAHRALDDVIVLYQVFKYMSDDLDIEQTYSLLSSEKAIKIMPFGKYQGRALKDIPEDYVKWLVKSEAFDKPENQPLKESFTKLGVLN
jgi:DNA polymerase III subunit epsilon